MPDSTLPRQIRFRVEGIHCASCTHTIRNIIKNDLAGFCIVKKDDADPLTKTVVATVEADCTLADNEIFLKIKQTLSDVFEPSGIVWLSEESAAPAQEAQSSSLAPSVWPFVI